MKILILLAQIFYSMEMSAVYTRRVLTDFSVNSANIGIV
jgi:hypothetical protein